MSGRLSSLRARLAKIDAKLIDVARQELLANCNCKFGGLTFAHDPEKFEAEMNTPCPVHGFRDLGSVRHVVIVGKHGEPIDTTSNSRLGQLIKDYEIRRARCQDDLRVLELKDDLEES